MQFPRFTFFGLLIVFQASGQIQFLVPKANWAAPPPVMAADAAGNTYLVSNTTGYGITAIKRDPSNQIAYTFSFAPQQAITPLAAAVDSQGDLFIGGWTSSTTYPQVNALLHPTPAGQGFLVKIDPTGTQLLFSTMVGGSDVADFVSSVQALAVDSAGDVYAAGGTMSPTFPITANAFQKSGGGVLDASSFRNRMSGFLMKISNSGQTLLYSTYLGGQTGGCLLPTSPAFSACRVTDVTALAVDDQSRPTVAGLTEEPDFPVTGGAYQTACCATGSGASTFVARFTADGSALEWSTFLASEGGYGATNEAAPLNGIRGLVLDAEGDAVVAGTTSNTNFPVTAGALQASYPMTANNCADCGPTVGFVTVISSDGSRLPYSTFYGGSAQSTLTGLAEDSGGNLWISGVANSSDLPKSANAADTGDDYVAELDPALSNVMRYYGSPVGSGGLTINLRQQNDVVVTGTANAVTAFPQAQPQVPWVWGIAGSSLPAEAPYIVPGALMSLYGMMLGPATALGTQLDATGKVATSLGGYSVTVNGIAAPLLYVGANQINFVVPFEVVDSPNATVQVISPSGSSQPVTGLMTAATQPEVFGPIVNQDGSINSAGNPAPANSIVSLWASGGGAMSGMVDGAVIQTALPGLLPQVSIAFGTTSGAAAGVITYAGPAPDFVAGALQINFQAPPIGSGYGACGPACEVVLYIGGSPVPPPYLTVWTAQ